VENVFLMARVILETATESFSTFACVASWSHAIGKETSGVKINLEWSSSEARRDFFPRARRNTASSLVDSVSN
jgi:hypothetical protein